MDSQIKSFKLRFGRDRIDQLAREYICDQTGKERAAEADIETKISPTTQKNRFYSRDDFLEVCRWKSPRIIWRAELNDEGFIRDVTSAALKSESERLRIEVLTLLDGVNWPVASVLLHFGHSEPYPILDFRALCSLNVDPPSSYTFPLWWDYVQVCRTLAKECGVTMRTLDRALWMFSKLNQPKSSG